MATQPEDRADATPALLTPDTPISSDAPAAPTETDELPRLSNWQAILYASGNVGSGVYYGFTNLVISTFLLGLGAPNLLSNLLSSTRSLEGAVIQPVVGAWSDRTWIPQLGGRRRPFIYWFMPISVILIIATPFIAEFAGLTNWLNQVFGWKGNTSTLVIVTAVIFLFTVSFNIMGDPYVALLADITPARQRGTINGFFQAVGAFSQVVILLLGSLLTGLIHGQASITTLFVITGVAILVFFIPTLIGLREPRNLPGDHAKKPSYTLRDYWRGLTEDPQMILYFLTVFFFWIGVGIIAPNLAYYVKNYFHISDQNTIDSITLNLGAILLLTGAVFVWPFGRLADRIGLKRAIFIGTGIIVAACVAGSFITSPGPLMIALAFAGVGSASQNAAGFPLLSRMTLPDRMGLYTGLSTAVQSVAAPVGAVVSAWVLTGIGYWTMFPFITLMFVLALVPLALLRPERSIAQRVARGELREADI